MLIPSQYKLEWLIGEGTSARVYKSGKYAIKIV